MNKNTKKNIGGNFFDKHNSKNFIIQNLMNNFYQTFLELIGNEKFNSILDIGCGEGHFTNLIWQKFHQRTKISAYEFDDNIVGLANNIYPQLNVKKGDILNIKEKYDLLVASEVLEHIPNYHQAIVSCKNSAKICIFSVPNEPWFRLANILRLKYLLQLGNTPGHVNHWTTYLLEKLLSSHFKKVKIISSGIWNIAVCKN